MFVQHSILVLAAIAAASGQQPEVKPARISGVVTNAITGEPVRKVQVRLSKESARGGPGQSAAATTDAAGRFVFDGIESATYRLSAQKPGFLTMQYGARRGSSRGTPIKLDAAQELTLDFKLPPQGVIAGRLVDEDGDPVMGASVTATRITASARTQDDGRSTATNDLGEFRLANLPAGRYLVLAHAQGRRFGERLALARRNEEPEREYAPTYYPGSLEAAGAAPVEVAPGKESGGIQFALVKTAVYRVRGKVTSASPLPQNLSIFLAPRKAVAGRRGGPGSGGRVGADGSFEILSVRPGSYYLVATPMGRGPRAGGRAPIDVSGDIDNASVTLSPPPTITGTVRIEGQATTDFGRARIFLRAAEAGGQGGAIGEVKPDGTFRIDNATPQAYLVIPFGFADNLYLKSVRLGTQPVTGKFDLAMAAPGVPLHIVMSPNAATVGGTVKEKDQPAGGVQVSLMPDPMDAANAWRVKQATTDQNGNFTLKGVAPGEYRVYALAEPTLGADLDPEFLKSYAAQATKVSVRENATAQVEVRLIDADTGR